MEKTQNGKLAKAAMIVMSSIILSRITGFLRVVLIPYRMGVSKTADAYNIAFLLPDLMFNLLVGGAIASALIPVLSGYIENKKEKEGWVSVSSFLNSIMLGIAVFCILGAIFTPQIIPVVAPGFKSKGIETQLLAINLTRVLFPSVSFLMLAGLCNGVLNSYRRFASAAYGPCIYNLGSAASIFIFGSKNAQDVQKVAYGVLASAFIYFVFQLVFTIKHLRFYRPSIHFKERGFIDLVKLAVPSLLSSSIVQLNVIISASFVTLFRDGSYTA
ncbi:MAG TPA: lipid II flippase MurJ, partial [Clostridia bacterium]